MSETPGRAGDALCVVAMLAALARCRALLPLVAVALLGVDAGAAQLAPVFDARADRAPRPPSEALEARIERELLPVAREAWRERCGGLGGFAAIDTARGAFTRPHAKQTAVLYRVCQIGRQNGVDAIAVFEGDRVVRHVSFDGHEAAIGALRDIDGDGVDELLVAGFGSGQGTFDGGVLFLELARGHARVLGGAATYHDDCGVSDAGTRTASVLRAAPGNSMRLFRDEYVRPCPARRAWRQTPAARPVRHEKDGTRLVSHR